MATAAAAIAARAHREVREYFFERGAFSADRAIEYDPSAPIQRRYFEQLLGEGAVHEVRPGYYWFDRPAYEEIQRRRFAWSMKILLVGAVLIAIVAGVQAVAHWH